MMNFFKRIKNLWRLSGIQIEESWEEINNRNILNLNNLKNIFVKRKATIVEPDVIEQLTEELK